MSEIDVPAYNVEAWNARVRAEDRWTVPVGPEEIAAARAGEWRVVLTPRRPVPASWFGELAGAKVLGLASGGGQQGPILAAAGAEVTVFDASDAQLEQDTKVAAREGLEVQTVQGDMRDLSVFEDGSFDLIFHPISNCFCPQVRPVWREAQRVLRPGGALLAGFVHPILNQLDPDALQAGRLEIVFEQPYADATSLSPAQLARWTDAQEPLVYGHSFEDQLAGQLEAGLVITDFFEDRGGDGPEAVADRYFAPYFATRAVKPR